MPADAGLRRAGIIAAGDGSRLRGAAPDLPKPLVRVAGKPLVHWVVESLRAAGADSITVLVNSRGTAVPASLREAFPKIAWTFLQQDTASSWESFRLVSRALAHSSERFLISTVDSLMRPEDCARFAREAFAPRGGAAPDAALALTRFVDDEKPLWADLDEAGRVSALGEDARRRETVTAGLYALSAGVAADMPPAAAYGKLRDFWKGLLVSGRVVSGVVLREAIDVDRPEDVATAERVTACFAA
ncbi:MAG TPA: NTP transferase domain-containing protein [Elusimicrobiota bacterium]|jgi:NDP-sugar pyrophosphorylase family protein|nr:NTP transferase domain-containing protein [Elusimicrobiota bacterium]